MPTQEGDWRTLGKSEVQQLCTWDGFAQYVMPSGEERVLLRGIRVYFQQNNNRPVDRCLTPYLEGVYQFNGPRGSVAMKSFSMNYRADGGTGIDSAVKVELSLGFYGERRTRGVDIEMGQTGSLRLRTYCWRESTRSGFKAYDELDGGGPRLKARTLGEALRFIRAEAPAFLGLPK